MNTATSSPADDVHHYVIPQKLLDYIFNKFPVFMHQWEKERDLLYPAKSCPHSRQLSCYTMARKHSVLNLREINRKNTHAALASVLTYYG
jgi:hypothetical protein